ncbi:MAG: NADH-dependent flavin oxidoreductase [Proteobacteria bacterium]|nr:NADH-dependent flavin oxidoreductase [Pseudomonadota bacterium]MBU1060851.1 NADH-dependent flavin oxidoreductase [Pseudomonadota bacterium]
MKTDILFSPFTIKNHSFRNRIGVAPMTRMSAGADSIPRHDVLDFLIRRAERGAALVYTEAIVTDYESGQGYPGQARLTNQAQIDAWFAVVQAIHAHGAKAIMQMFHCGRMAWPEVNPAHRAIAPSAVSPSQNNPLTGFPYPRPEEMSHFDIDHVIQGFVETARGAVAAGFDGVEIHGAHGYLISQFLSSYSNKRHDEYGGSVENRFSFAREIIRAVRRVVPGDRLLLFRVSNWGVADREVSLFASQQEWQAMIALLDREELDALSLSTYRFSDLAFASGQNMAQLTRAVTSLPLLICGQIHDRATAEAALKNADLILSGKSLLLNPNWVEGVRDGKVMPLYSSDEANIAYTEEPLP